MRNAVPISSDSDWTVKNSPNPMNAPPQSALVLSMLKDAIFCPLGMSPACRVPRLIAGKEAGAGRHKNLPAKLAGEALHGRLRLA